MTGLTTRATVMRSTGGRDVLVEERDWPIRAPGPDEVLVRVEAAGVNFMDIYHRRGDYPVTTPCVPGIEGAGTVEATGTNSTALVPGQRVAFLRTILEPGAYAERVTVPTRQVVSLPNNVETSDAAAVLLQGISSHYLTHASYEVRDGDVVLVHAAAGGLGLLLVQMAKTAGATVIGTTSTQEKARRVEAVGADHVTLYTSGDIVDSVMELTNGEGVHAVFDGVGKATFDASLAALRNRGTLVVFGTPSGDLEPLDTWRLWDRSLKLTRTQIKHHIETEQEYRMRAEAVFGAVSRRDLQVTIDRRFPLSDAGAAQSRLEERQNIGKVLILPG